MNHQWQSGSLRVAGSLLAALALAAPAARALTVRVDPAGGAPRLVVDGAPVRARMFWGAPGAAPLPIGPTWQEVNFEFTAVAGATNGTMHFRFGQTAGEVDLDDLRVTDATAAHDLIAPCDFEGGPLPVDIGRTGPVRDLLTGARIGAGPQFTLPIRRGETVILDCGGDAK